MAAARSPDFRGRAAERDQLDRLLQMVRGGESAALIVRGEAGIGKTALLDQCAGRAAGFRLARIAGMESEMELPFAGLHQLCAPMLAAVDNLPEPQRDALHVAFGLTSGDPPDRFLVALATLSLLAEVARKRPLLCLVDDAQWLDAASGQVLGFVARRILAESVLMLFAIREPSRGAVSGRTAGAHAGRPRRRGRPRTSLGRHSWWGRCQCPGSNRGGNPRQSTGALGTASGHDRGRTGRWIRRSPLERSSWPARGALSQASRRAARGHPAADAGGIGGSDRGRWVALARRADARNRAGGGRGHRSRTTG